MSGRKYKAVVTVTVTTPEGVVLGTSTEEGELEQEMLNETSGEIDEYVKGELDTLARIAIAHMEDCF